MAQDQGDTLHQLVDPAAAAQQFILAEQQEHPVKATAADQFWIRGMDQPQVAVVPGLLAETELYGHQAMAAMVSNGLTEHFMLVMVVVEARVTNLLAQVAQVAEAQEAISTLEPQLV